MAMTVIMNACGQQSDLAYNHNNRHVSHYSVTTAIVIIMHTLTVIFMLVAALLMAAVIGTTTVTVIAVITVTNVGSQ